MSDSLQNITLHLEHVTGGVALGATASRPARVPSSGSSSTLQTALTGVTAALDSLKQNQNKNPIEQLLPMVLMAKWARQNG